MTELKYVELIRIGDPIESDLLAAFLEDGNIEFQIVNRSSAGFMSHLIPRAANPIIFRILKQDLERGKILLEEYHRLQTTDPLAIDTNFPSDDSSSNDSVDNDSLNTDSVDN